MRSSQHSRPAYPRARIRRPSLPLWTIVLLGTVFARITNALESEPLRWSAGVLSLVGVSVWCSLRFPRPQRWFVGAGTLLALLLLLLVVRSYRLTWMLIGVLIASMLVYGYGYLSTWLVRPRETSAVSTEATAFPVSRRVALVIPLLIQFAVLIVTWSYMERPGTALDLVRRANGIRRIHAFPAGTNMVVLSPDGTRALSMDVPYAVLGDPEPAQGHTYPVSVWDIRTRTVMQTLHQPLHQSFFNEAALSHGGELVAFDNRAEIHVWRVDDGALVARLPLGARRKAGMMQFSPDASLLAVSDRERAVVQLWSLRDGSLLRTLAVDEMASIVGLAFSPDGQLLALHDGDVRIWRVADGALQRTLATTMIASAFPPSLAFSPDGHLLAIGGLTGDDTVAELWRVSDGVVLHRFRDTQTDTNESLGYASVAFSANGTRLMTTTRWTAATDVALLWNVQDRRLLRRFDPAIGIHDLRFAPHDTEALVSDGPYLFAFPADLPAE